MRNSGQNEVVDIRENFIKILTLFGRRLWLPEINSPNGPRRAGAERAAINAPMQGTAADLIKLAMIAVQDWIEQENLGKIFDLFWQAFHTKFLTGAVDIATPERLTPRLGNVTINQK